MGTSAVLMIGGFLGAGKTTLMRRAATMFAARGEKVGVVTNDLATDMVDTRLFLQEKVPVQELTGSCFCCNFNGFIEALRKLRSDALAGRILAETVGSCTDISATVVQPLKDKFPRDFRVGPLSVVLDPARLCEVFPSLSGGVSSRLHENAAYIVRKQLEEADILLLNKKDTLDAAALDRLTAFLRRTFPQTRVLAVSALNGDGLEEWLNALGESAGTSGRLADVDYDTYADGEARLGWLNASARLKSGAKPTDWRNFCETFLRTLNGVLQEKKAGIGHVKILLWMEGSPQNLAANSVHTGEPSSPLGGLPAGTTEVNLLVNARVEMASDALKRIVGSALDEVCAALGLAQFDGTLNDVIPGRPEPTWRYDRLVEAG